MRNVGKLTSFLLPLSESTLSMTCRLGTQFLHVSFQPCIDGKEEDWVQSIGREREGRGGVDKVGYNRWMLSELKQLLHNILSP